MLDYDALWDLASKDAERHAEALFRYEPPDGWILDETWRRFAKFVRPPPPREG